MRERCWGNTEARAAEAEWAVGTGVAWFEGRNDDAAAADSCKIEIQNHSCRDYRTMELNSE